MNKNLRAYALRQISGAPLRYAAIFTMLLLSAFFFVGLISIGPTMEKTLVDYTAATDMADITITHPMGLSKEDLRVAAETPGVIRATRAAQIPLQTTNRRDVIMLEGLADFPKLDLIRGHLPRKRGEMVLEAKMADRYPLGSRIHFSDGDGQTPQSPDTASYTVVGYVNSPEHLQDAFSQISVPMGDGLVDAFGWILPSHFKDTDVQIIRLFFAPGTDLPAAKKDLQLRFARRARDRQDNLLRQAREGLAAGDRSLEGEYARLNQGPAALSQQDQQLTANQVTLDEMQASFLMKESQGRNDLRNQDAAMTAREAELQEGMRQLTQGLAAYDKARADLSQKDRVLQDGRRQLATSARTLREKGRALDTQAALLTDRSRALDGALDKWEKGRRQLLDGKNALAEKGRSLQDGENRLNAGRRELAAETARLEEGRRQLAAAQRELDHQRSSLAPAEQQLQTLQEQANQFQKGLTQLQAAHTAEAARIFEKAAADLAPLKAQKAQLIAGIDLLKGKLADLEADPSPDPFERVVLTTQLKAKESALSKVQAEITTVKATSDRDLAALDTEFAGRQQGLESQLTPLTNGIQALDEKIRQARTALQTGQARLNAKQEDLLNGEQKLARGRDQLAAEGRRLAAGRLAFSAAQVALAAKESLLYAQKDPLDRAARDLARGKSALQAGKAALSQADDHLTQERAKLDDGDRQLSQAAISLSQKGEALANTRANLLAADRQLAAGQLQLAVKSQQAKVDLNQGRQALTQQSLQLADGRTAFDAFRAASLTDMLRGDASLQKARADLIDSELATRRLSMPAYTVETRLENNDYNVYYNYATGIRLMARIFPVFFYLIALLITLSTMVRMIDEARGQIGTLKALGYDNRQITSVYVLYGVAAAVPAAFFGALGGALILVPQIWRTYGSSFIFTEPHMAVSPVAIALAFVLNLSCTALAAYWATRRILSDNAASLLRPKAPAVGNRILLERWQGLWRRLGFQQKMTIRNLFRYKKRGLLTIIGVTGCTALLTMGFGLHHAVSNIFPMQFDELSHYDLLVTYDANALEGDRTRYENDLTDSAGDRLKMRNRLRVDQGNLVTDKGIKIALAVMVPENTSSFTRQVTLRDRHSHRPLDLRQGAILTEQTARHMKIGVGDDLVYEDAYGITRKVPITALCENYVGNTLFMDQSTYAHLRGYRPQMNADMLTFSASTDEGALVRQLLKNDIVLATSRTADTTAGMDTLLDSLGVMIFIIVAVSMSLALVVLYNLTNINVEERMRELSTIKVLGFYAGEVTAYIYRETGFLTALGILIGLPLGKFMHFKIITVLAPAHVMMDPKILVLTYLLAVVFTIIVSLLVMLLMHRKLRKVDMIEALKGVE